LAKIVPTYIETIPNRNSPPAILLREGRREGKRVLKTTIANLSHWPAHIVEALRLLLRGETLVPADTLFSVVDSNPHGHVEAVLGALRRLGVDRLLASKPCRERDLVIAMIVQRILGPGSKLADVRRWSNTTLAEELSVADADVDELYDALDWLLGRKEAIEKRLAKRHLIDGALVLYDVSSSYYEGSTCPLAQLGHDRDEKRNRPIIVYGVLTDREGCPVAVDIYPGATGDPTTVPDQVDKLRHRFGLSQVVLVGDRGMLTSAQIKTLRQHPGLGWISALRSAEIRKLVASESLQMSLFDEQNLAEIRSPDHPGERLIACFNPLLAEERRRKRDELLAATEAQLERVAGEVARRTKTPFSSEEIGAKVGRVLHRFKVGKHFDWRVDEGQLQFSRRQEAIKSEAALDGIYVIRTSATTETLSAENVVRNYKRLAQVEQAFRCLKNLDLKIRPIFHRTEDHVRAHIFLCLLAYYVEWHLRKVWAPLLFEDEDLTHDRNHRDPVAQARPSASVKAKKATRKTADDSPVHSFQTLLGHLAKRSRNTCRPKNETLHGATLQQVTEPTPLQAKALGLLKLLPG
jgi:Transposase DDE domain